jgi:hypothetical protein
MEKANTQEGSCREARIVRRRKRRSRQAGEFGVWTRTFVCENYRK